MKLLTFILIITSLNSYSSFWEEGKTQEPKALDRDKEQFNKKLEEKYKFQCVNVDRVIRRCENHEVFCYTSATYKETAINCFKK